jgi:phenylacetate-CoA ligase
MIETWRTWLLLRQLRSHLGQTAQALRAHQDGALRRAVGHASRHVPFYQRLWRERGFDASRFRGLDDLERLPVLGHAEARDAMRRGELVARDVDATAYGVIHTTGSSGTLLRIPMGPAEERLWRAQGLRIGFAHGFRWHHRKVQFNPEPGSPHVLQRIGISRTTWIRTALPIEDQARQFVASEADWIGATPTVLRRLAQQLAVTRRPFKRPRGILCQGELLDEETRRASESVFGVTPVSLYGTTELGYVAWQCGRREGFHVGADTHVVEVVRDGRAVGAGELGTLVVTALFNRTMPFVRYDTGDLAIAAAGPCPCGITLPLLASIEGRVAGAVVLGGGRILTTRTIVNHLAGALRLGDYHLHQEGATRFRLALSDDRDGARTPDGVILTHLRALLGDVNISIVAGTRSSEEGSKTRAVQSDVARPLT